MEVKAWIQMGCERREVTFDVSDEEIEEVGMDKLATYIEEAVMDWKYCRYGWGWSCSRFEIDYGINEDSNCASFSITSEVLNPRTKRMLVARKFCLGDTALNSQPWWRVSRPTD